MKTRSKGHDVVDGDSPPPVAHNKKQTVNQLITTDHHDLKDLSNKSFSFHELHDEMVGR